MPQDEVPISAGTTSGEGQMPAQTAQEIVARVVARDVTAAEVVASSLQRIDASNPAVNAFTAVYRQRALATAQQVDEKLRRGENLPLVCRLQ